VRDGTGPEQLYDIYKDPAEETNLAETPEGRGTVESFREMLLNVLERNPASTEVEHAYLGRYREWLQALVQAPRAPQDRRDGKATALRNATPQAGAANTPHARDAPIVPRMLR
jgi:hypothetical protein